jgi:LysR family glycine cleavage system transcriptional activator
MVFMRPISHRELQFPTTELEVAIFSNRGTSRSDFLDALIALDVVLRAGSFRSAAKEMNVGHLVVMRRVRALEGWLGQSLVEPGPRGTQGTRAAAMLLGEVRPSLRVIEDRLMALRREARGRTLRIHAVAGFASEWLAPRLSEASTVVGGTALVLRPLSNIPLDRQDDGCDVIITTRRADDLAESAVLLARPEVFPIAAPALILRPPDRMRLNDIFKMPLLYDEDPIWWDDWLAAIGETGVTLPSAPQLLDCALLMSAVRAGQGVALANSLTAARALASGDVVRLGTASARLEAYVAIIKPGARRNKALRLVQWMRRALQEPAP